MDSKQENDPTYDAETGEPLWTNKRLVAHGIRDFGTTIYVGTRDEWAFAFHDDLYDWYEEDIAKERKSKEWQIKYRDYAYEAPTFEEWLEPILDNLAKATEEDVAKYRRLGQSEKRGIMNSLKCAIAELNVTAASLPVFPIDPKFSDFIDEVRKYTTDKDVIDTLLTLIDPHNYEEITNFIIRKYNMDEEPEDEE